MQGTSLWVASEDGGGSVGVTTRTSSLNIGSSVWIYTCRAGAPSRVNCTAAGEPSKVIFTGAEGEGEDGAFWMKMWVSSREIPSSGWGVLTPRAALTCAASTPGPGPPRAPPSLPPPSNPVPALAALTP